MKTPRLMIAAPKSGSGKTVITCALLELAKRFEKNPRAYKCGPDYIDPMFHKEVLGISSTNLDSFFLEDEALKSVFLHGNEEGKEQISIVEGVMGLFDGLGGVSEKASAYDLASILQIPIVFVVDAHGMGRSILPMLAGFLKYDRNHLIRGFILNQTSEMFCKTISPLIEKEFGIPVLGCMPKCELIRLESRHLGLKMPTEILDCREQVKKAADCLSEHISLEAIWKIASEAPDLTLEKQIEKQECCMQEHKKTESGAFTLKRKIPIGVAYDEAFCFYYAENLRLLEELGAELIYFSPLRDVELPDSIQGVLFGGGYPELYAEQLAKNETMKQSVREAIQNGMPSIAECGGFMYLHDKIIMKDGTEHAFCGVIPATVFRKERLVRFGYIELQSEKDSGFLAAKQRIRGHEFHYYDSTKNGEDCRAVKPIGNREYLCVHSQENRWWGFPHLYYLSCPAFAKNFIEAAGRYHK